MPVTLISASGTQYPLIVNPDGSINAQTTISGISIGSIVVSDVDGTMYIVSGNNMVGSAYCYQKTDPWTISGNVLISGNIGVNNLGSETWIKGGSILIYDRNPADASKYNYDTFIIYSGTAAGSIYRATSAGSFVRVITYDGSDNPTKLSSWSAV